MKLIITSLLLVIISTSAMAQVEIGANAGLVSTAFLSEQDANTVKWGAGISMRYSTSPNWGIRLEANYHDKSFKGTESGPEPFDFKCSQGFLGFGLLMDYRAHNKFGVLFGLSVGSTLYENHDPKTTPGGYSYRHADESETELGVLGGLSYTVLDGRLTIEGRAQLGATFRYQYATYKLVARYNIPLKEKN